MSNHVANGSCYLFLCCIAVTTPPATTVFQQPVDLGLSTGAIAGIAVGAVVLLVITIVIIVGTLVCNGKKNKVVPGRRQEDEVLSEEQ